MSDINGKWNKWFTKSFGKSYIPVTDVLGRLTEDVSYRLLKVRGRKFTHAEVASVLDIAQSAVELIYQADEVLSGKNGNPKDKVLGLSTTHVNRHYKKENTDIEIITPREVQELLSPKEDGLLKEAAEVVKEVVKGNLEQHIFDGYYEVYLSQVDYPEKIVQRLGEMLEQAGWDVRLSSQDAAHYEDDPSTRLVLKIKEGN